MKTKIDAEWLARVVKGTAGLGEAPPAGRPTEATEMSDGLSDANRGPDYTRDPVFGICNNCKRPHCRCAATHIDELEVELAAERTRCDEALHAARDLITWAKANGASPWASVVDVEQRIARIATARKALPNVSPRPKG